MNRKEREFAERIVLGHFALFPDDACALWQLAAGIVGWLDQHRHIAAAVGTCMASGTAPSLLNVGRRLHDAGHVGLVTDYALLARDATFGGLAMDAARRLLQDDARQGLGVALSGALSRIKAGDEAEDLGADVSRAIQHAASIRDSIVVEGGGSIAERLRRRIKASQNGEAEPPFLPTGNPDLDRLVGGLRVGLWTVIGARPKQGKTAWWEQLVAPLARRGHGAIVASLEMAPEDHLERIGIRESRCRLDSREIYRAATEHTVDRHASLRAAVEAAGELPITWVRSQRRRQLSQLISDLTLARQTNPGARVVVVDYMQLIRPDRQASRMDLALADVSTALCEWLSGTGMAGILVAQLNRAVEKENRAPRLSDIREAGQLEQDAGTVLLLHRPQNGPQGKGGRIAAEIVVAAARFGGVGAVPLWWLGPEIRFEPRDDTTASWV